MNIIAINNTSPVHYTGNFGGNVREEKKPLPNKDDYKNTTSPLYYPNLNVVYWDDGDRAFADYKKSLNTKNPKKAMDIINKKSMTPEATIRFLTKVTSDEDTSSKFIDEIIRDEKGNFDPKKSNDVVKTLVEKTGGKENFEDWYFKNDGYLEAFQKYGMNFYENTDDFNELCSFIPNWGPWALNNKFKNVYQKDGKEFYVPKLAENPGKLFAADGFTIGEVPKEFKDKEGYRQFIEKIQENRETLLTKQHLELDETSPIRKIRTIGSGDSGKMNLVLDDKYIMKLNPWRYQSKDSEIHNELCDAAPDSNYMNALVDFYSNKYSPKSSVKMHYYDSYTSSTLYEIAKGKEAEFECNGAQANNVSKDFLNEFSDLWKTGVRYTDFKSDNYIKTKDGVKCIDSGHASYFDILKPGIKGLTMGLPSRTGFSTIEFHGALLEAVG